MTHDVIERYHEAVRNLDQAEEDFKAGRIDALTIAEIRQEHFLASAEMEALRRSEKERAHQGTFSPAVSASFNPLTEVKYQTSLNNHRLEELIRERKRAQQELIENLRERRHRYAYQRALRSLKKEVSAGRKYADRETLLKELEDLTKREAGRAP